MAKRLGRQTVELENPPYIVAHAAVGGKKEQEGPLKRYFDHLTADDTFGEKTWEKAERQMQKLALQIALEKWGKDAQALDYLLAGDLLNQCVSSSFAARETQVPFWGLYGACSTMGESIALASLLIDGGGASTAGAVTSSHFCTAERQYRTPLAYGGQRTPTAQWTATAAGCSILSKEGRGPRVTCVTTGKIVDKGIKDANNMGAAMAPAAADTLLAHFRETGREPGYYDLVVTGDLGQLGREILLELTREDGLDLEGCHNDCGLLLYDLAKQDVHCGGSGCGCAGSVFNGYLLRQMEEGTLKKILLCPTGALLSPTTTQQGESIPSIAHAVAIEM